MAIEMFRGFEFKRRDTLIHRLDPRTKLIMSLSILVSSLIFDKIIPLLLVFLISFALISISKSVTEWYKSIKGLSVLFLIILIVNSFAYSLSFAIAMCIRLVNFVTAFSLFFLTTHPDDLAHALISLRIPFEIAFAFSMATRYVPTLAREAQIIAEAQMSRGLELQKGGFLQRVRNLIPLIVPLVICSIKRALSVAESLESRCFGAVKKRTYLHELKFGLWDFLMSFAFLGLVIWSAVTTFLVGYPRVFTLELPI
ncbi:MAG: energy-coupling factor transporter transmembrane component T family protein [Candidatus Baldrarchaeia archaeon]